MKLFEKKMFEEDTGSELLCFWVGGLDSGLSGCLGGQ